MGRIQPILRFWPKTKVVGSCLEWTGATKGPEQFPYGVFQIGHTTKNRRTARAHRWIYEQVCGPIPSGMVVMHACDNPRCVKLQHLELATQAQNIADMYAKGRAWFQMRGAQ